MNAPAKPAHLAPPVVDFELDGRPAQARAGETILQAADRLGVPIPRLCYTDGLRADGNCRACVVEIEGERTLAPSCCRAVQPGMKVKAGSERARKSQQMVLELLLADLPTEGYKWLDDDAAAPHGELSQWAAQAGVQVRPALQALRRDEPAPDVSHPAMAVNLSACIQCTRCVRACREAQVNDVIGYAGRGSHARIVFDLEDPMGASSCVACGECVQACPTGALMPKTQLGPQRVDRQVDSVCPFCGVGCQISYNVKDGRIVSVSGRDGPANEKRLCVKGRFGFDYVASPDRLTVPLIRKPGVAKDPAHCEQPPDWREVFREASWEEALDLAAGQLVALKQQHGARALAGFGSAKGSNEEAYLFQKLVRTGFGSNNVDHCTRLCHASSVAALLEGVGSGAVSNPVKDVEHAELILIIGSNPTANHPVAATWMKNAAQRGAKIVLADPRVTDIARHAWRVLQFKPDADVALLNAMLHVIVTEGLVDADFLRERADHYAALVANVQGYSPEAMAPVCGIPAETIREVARAYAMAGSSIILWGMGVSQHVHGTDNVRCLIALATCTGQIGRPGTGKKLGIVGMGRIGQELAKRAQALEMIPAYHNRNRRPDVDLPYFATPVELARWADVLVLACPGGPATHHLVNESVIEALGPQGWLVNISRGSVVDEPALVKALEEGRIRGAGLDVFADEPRVPEALLKMENVVLTPHHASATDETRDAMAQLVVDNLRAHFAGRPLLTAVA